MEAIIKKLSIPQKSGSYYPKVLSKTDFADILLVAHGFKPSALIEVSLQPKSRISKKQFNAEVKTLRRKLKKLSLYFRLSPCFSSSCNLNKASFVSSKKEILASLVRAEKIKNDKTRRLTIGKLLGYPMSSVRAFAEGRSIETTSLPKRILKKPEMAILNFRLSKNWKKELLYLKKKAFMLKKIAPELYQDIIRG